MEDLLAVKYDTASVRHHRRKLNIVYFTTRKFTNFESNGDVLSRGRPSPDVNWKVVNERSNQKQTWPHCGASEHARDAPRHLSQSSSIK